MPRTVDAVAYATRREAFVEVAEGLIQAKGYEQLSIQDILAELGASKGAFYHYFGSKAALLEAVVEHIVEAAMSSLTPHVTDPAVPALDKLRGVFVGIAQWKGERTELMRALIEVWLSDENAIVREKLRRSLVPRLAPLLAAIIREGVAEGVFAVDSPDGVARVLVSLIQGANDTALELYVARQAGAVSLAAVERFFAAYTAALERLLGLPAASLMFPDRTVLLKWYG